MKFFDLVTILIGGSIIAWVSYGFLFEATIETPNFILNKSFKNIEIRSYEQLKIYRIDERQTNRAFNELFQTINGANKSQLKIPMTAPVLQQTNKMIFILPSKLKEIPKPTNQLVETGTIPPLTVAVIPFKGGNPSKVLENTKKFLLKENITISNEWYICDYNSPWVFPFFRKRELWIVVTNMGY